VLDSKDFMDAVWDAVVELYGEYGASRSGLALIDYVGEKRLAVLRVVHTEVEMVRAALASITEVLGKPAALHVLAISGTIKALHKKVGM
jgi:RNase P/RNase MRP subunit POP5